MKQLRENLPSGSYIGTSEISVIRGHLSMLIRIEDFDNDYDKVSEVAHQIVSGLCAVVAFYKQWKIDYQIDFITDIVTGGHYFKLLDSKIDKLPCLQRFQTVQDSAINFSLETRINIYVRRAISEIDAAIRRPDIAPLHCMVAIETVRSYFGAEIGEKKPTQWLRMRSELSIDEASVRFVQDMSNYIRHGNVKYFDPSSRSKCVTIASEIVQRLIDLLHSKATSNSAPVFDLLVL